MSQQKEYFHFVQVLRGGAAFLVTWSHLVGWWLPRYQPSTTLMDLWNEYFVQPLNIYQNGGRLGVLIFFLISGFVTAHTSQNEDWKVFLSKRFFRIVPSFVIALIMTAGIANLCVNIGIDIPLGTESVDIVDYILTFFLIDHIMGTPSALGVTWSLFVEILFYIIMALLLKYTKKAPYKSMMCFVTIITALILLAPVSFVLAQIADYAVYSFFILLGAIIYYGYKKMITTYQTILLSVTCLVLYVLLYESRYPGILFAEQMPAIYTVISAIIIFLIAMSIIEKPNKIMNFLGNISYPLYLIHLPVGCLVLNLFQSHGIAYKYSIPCAFFVCFTVSFIMFKYFEKPLQKKINDVIKEKSLGKLKCISNKRVG